MRAANCVSFCRDVNEGMNRTRFAARISPGHQHRLGIEVERPGRSTIHSPIFAILHYLFLR